MSTSSSNGNGKEGGLPLSLGTVVATKGAIEAIAKGSEPLLSYLVAHATGDWGDVDVEDQAMNDFAVRYGGRVLSVYTLSTGERIWIITVADRSQTTVLLPSDY